MHALGPQGTADSRPHGNSHRPGSARGARRGPISLSTLCTIVAVAVCWAPSASAQFRVGANGVYQSGAFDGSFGVGGRAEVSLGRVVRGLTLVGTYDHLFPDCADCSASDAGLQLLLAPPSGLYLGLGANMERFDDGLPDAGAESDLALNVIAGVRLPLLPVVVPFLELRQEVLSDGINQQTVALGVILSTAGARNVPRRPRSR